MPLYYFHLHDGKDEILDPEGAQLATLDQAIARALHHARSIISHEALRGSINLDQRIDVENSERAVLHSLAFQDVVAIRRAEDSTS